MNPSRNNWSGILIAVFSALIVFGALLTALAQTNFQVEINNDTPSQPTATFVQIISKTPGNQEAATATFTVSPAADQPTQTNTSSAATPQSITATEGLTAYTKTPETDGATASSTSAPTSQSASCGVPAGWKTYTVKSGDTLYSISVKFQSSVNDIKYANCLYSNTIITGTKLWVPNNPTITPTKTPVPTKTEGPTETPKPTSPTCYALTLSVASGSGSVPSASPTNSSGCAAGKYVAGEVITLTAAPNSGWTVGSWSGTSNNASTSTTNTLTMPASAKSASVTYTQICYALSLSVASGNGSVPSASPTNSTGCAAGTYHAGEVITLTAAPNSGWSVGSWSGTSNDASTSTTNTLTMPASAKSASVTYTQICYALSLSVASGNGSVPTASPTNSTGCAAGTYHAGESITLSALPDSGWTVDSWSGDTTTNSLIMPASAAAVSVTYVVIPAPPPPGP